MHLQCFCVALVFLPGRTPSAWGEILQPPTHFTQYLVERRTKPKMFLTEGWALAPSPQKPCLVAKILLWCREVGLVPRVGWEQIPTEPSLLLRTAGMESSPSHRAAGVLTPKSFWLLFLPLLQWYREASSSCMCCLRRRGVLPCLDTLMSVKQLGHFL